MCVRGRWFLTLVLMLICMYWSPQSLMVGGKEDLDSFVCWCSTKPQNHHNTSHHILMTRVLLSAQRIQCDQVWSAQCQVTQKLLQTQTLFPNHDQYLLRAPIHHVQHTAWEKLANNICLYLREQILFNFLCFRIAMSVMIKMLPVTWGWVEITPSPSPTWLTSRVSPPWRLSTSSRRSCWAPTSSSPPPHPRVFSRLTPICFHLLMQASVPWDPLPR